MKSHIVYGLMGLFASTAMAQMPKVQVEPMKIGVSETVRDTDGQIRRSSLRATLKSQMDVAIKTEALHPSERQLSAAQRAELRQQLRQQ